MQSTGSSTANDQNFSKNITFHQSYSYEDFVEGIRPDVKDDKVTYDVVDGIFKEIAEDAKKDPDHKYVLVIDEINRGNITKIFGELITLIESDKRRKKYQVTLPYTRGSFWIPENLFIIGTMNTADRSIAQIDTALRRRFAFEELMPDTNLKELNKKIDGISLKDLLSTLNSRIKAEGPQFRDKQIGHSYFMKIKNIEDLQITFAVEIIPLLQDYFYQNYEKLEKKILNSDFIDSSKYEIKSKWKNDEKIFKEAINKILTSK
jgi:5-methylcytosine-specific restriction protein B